MRFSTVCKLSLVIGLTMAFWTSCQKPYHAKSERYVFVASHITLPYWQDAKAGFLGAAREMGVRAEFIGPKDYNPEQELTDFKNAVATHPSGILISPAQPGPFVEPINEAVQNGIPVICVDSDSPQSKRILFIGTDNYNAGMTTGKLMAGLLHGQGRIMLLTIPGQFNLEERLRGVEDALKAYPYISFYEVDNDRGDPQVANSEVSAVLQKNVDIKGILCLEASGGPGAAQAVDHFGDDGKITIVAMDANPETLDWISKGVIAATVAQKPYTMAFYGLRFLDDLHHNSVHEFKSWQDAPASPIPARVDTGTAVINSENVDDFKTALALGG